MTGDAIVYLKITLDDVTPQVLRRIEAPSTIRLDRLHRTFDPNDVDLDFLNRKVQALAKRWSRKPAVRRKPHI